MDTNHPSRVLLRQFLTDNPSRARELFNQITPARKNGPTPFEVLDAQCPPYWMTLFESVKVHASSFGAVLSDLARYEMYVPLSKEAVPNGSPPPQRDIKSGTIA